MNIRHLAPALTLGIAAAPAALAPVAPANAQSVIRPSHNIVLSIGRGELVSVPGTMADVFVADSTIADVEVKSRNQLFLLGKEGGETTVYASDARGKVIWTANVRVGSNISSIDQMLTLAMPEARISSTTIGSNAVLLTGTVKSPEDIGEAERLASAYLGEETKVISRLRMATPLQVNLQVRFAEVSRSLVRQIGSNIQTRDDTGGFMFGLNRGRDIGRITDLDTSNLPTVDASADFGFPPGTLELPFDPVTRQYRIGGTAFPAAQNLDGQSAINLAGRLFGVDIASAIDVGERLGLVHSLSTTNLTALSGETSSFLAGGEYPIPQRQGFGAVTVTFREYGVRLEYTPTVLTNGRISMRVRPEVSELTSQGAVTVEGFQVPALITRKAETTVELGSGQSFMIAGLMSNNMQNQVEKTPGLGDVPVLGNLFRSSDFRRGETELVIVVTPYLVKPVDAGDIRLPTDGFRVPDELERNTLFKASSGQSGGQRPGPTMREGDPAGPEMSGTMPGELPPAPGEPARPEGARVPAADRPRDAAAQRQARTPDPTATPGFSFE